jgi:hypothetical protein
MCSAEEGHIHQILRPTVSSFSRLAGSCAVLAAAFGAAVAFAAESEGRNVPVTRTPDNDAVSSTRREFDTIKTARDPNLQQKGEVPRLTAPEMPATSGTGWAPTKAKQPEKKSKNWLVDAMQKPTTDGKRATRGPGESELDHARDGSGRVTEEDGLQGEMNRRSESQAGDGRGPERKSSPTVVANPLNHYLGEWMTSQDYSLLKPGLAQSAMAGPGGRDSALLPAIQMPGGKSLPGLDATSGLMSSSTAGLAPSPIPKPNPYLETMNAPAIKSTQPAYAPPSPTMPSSLKPIISAVPPPPPIIEPARSKVPDFAKPAQDEKYFKQLKRF